MPSTSSATGFDMGAISLNPYTFSQIQAIATSQTSTSSHQNTTTLVVVAAVLVVIIVVGVAFVMMRRRGSSAQVEPSPTS